MYDKNYIKGIADKLDRMNKINGFVPNIDKKMQEIDGYSNDIFGALGSAGLSYMKKSKENQEQPLIDPLFRDHNSF